MRRKAGWILRIFMCWVVLTTARRGCTRKKLYGVIKTHCMNILFTQFQNSYIFYSITNDKYSRLSEKSLSFFQYEFCKVFLNICTNFRHVYTVALANVQHTVYCFNHLLVYKDYLCMKRDGTFIGREGKTTFEQQHTICT